MPVADLEPSLKPPVASLHASPGGRPRAWHGVLIAALSLSLIVFCWDAGFTTYDDSSHVFANAQLSQSFTELLMPAADRTYFPVTEFSYKIDQKLFYPWINQWLGSLAPGIRAMTLLYHACAALILWRVLLLLRLSAMEALFVAALFSCHPLATETVCWASERKNALAGMFGFASLWAWLRFDGHMVRMPLVVLFYLLALLSKPSALGLLPVFFFLEVFNGSAGLNGVDRMYLRPCRAWITSIERLLPLALLAAFSTIVNIRGHAITIQPPPGGTVFTALLTDLEILARYLFNIFVPVNLSISYFVDPIRSLFDPRVALYALMLTAIVALTIWLSQRRRLAVFGWLWFLGALGPNLNLIAIPHIMQDRYIYLSCVGVLVVLLCSIEGLMLRLRSEKFTAEQQGRVLRIAAIVYVGALVALSVDRSRVWRGTLEVFHDAVQKQPKSSFARYGLGNAYAQAWQIFETRDPARANEFRKKHLEEWKAGVDDCPDAGRYAAYMVMALNVANEFSRTGDLKAAERYWQIAAAKPTECHDFPTVRASAVSYLAELRMAEKRFEDAHALARQAVDLCYDFRTVMLRARTALALAGITEKESPRYAELLKQAREDLESIPQNAAQLYPLAQKLLSAPPLK
ncbi:MAG TPA: hypothetical protein VEK08_05785 [Planctomycetota bacterium]|nr:hypothetical protein [Planctomycetota bacterium]